MGQGEKQFAIALTEEEVTQDALGNNIKNIEETFETDDNVNIEKVRHTNVVNGFPLTIK